MANLILYVLHYVTVMLPSAAAAALLMSSFAFWITCDVPYKLFH